jgi:hypothetical protein
MLGQRPVAGVFRLNGRFTLPGNALTIMARVKIEHIHRKSNAMGGDILGNIELMPGSATLRYI